MEVSFDDIRPEYVQLCDRDADTRVLVDGDTDFDVNCIYELIQRMRRGGLETVGVCGAVLVKFDENPLGFW